MIRVRCVRRVRRRGRVGRVGRMRRVSGRTLTKTDLLPRDPRATWRIKDKCVKIRATALLSTFVCYF